MLSICQKTRTVQSPWRPLLWLAAAMGLMLLAACAAMVPRQHRIAWQCDAVLDAAVTRGDWESALEGHRQLLRRNPENCLAVYHLGYIWGRLGNRIQEAAAYEQAIACGYNQDDRLYFNLAMAYGELDQRERAVEALESAIRIDPSNGDHYFGMALMAKADGRLGDTEMELLRALSVDPAHLEARLELVRFYLDQSRWDDARKHLSAVKGLDPENQEAQSLQRLMETRQAARYDRWSQ